MRPILALFLSLSAAGAFAETPAPASPPPGLSRSNWDKAVQHARSLNDAVKSQIERMDWAEDGPKAMTPGSGRAGRTPKAARLRRYASPAPRTLVPEVTSTSDLKTLAPKAEAAAASGASGKGPSLLPLDPLSIHAMPSLDQTLVPFGPEAVAPRLQAPPDEEPPADPLCADPRSRADAGRCPAGR